MTVSHVYETVSEWARSSWPPGERVVRAPGVEQVTVEEVTSGAGIAKATFSLDAELYRVPFFEPAPTRMTRAEGQWSNVIARLVTRFVETGIAVRGFAVADREATSRLPFHAQHGLPGGALRRPDVFDRARVIAVSPALVAAALTGAAATTDNGSAS